MRLFTLFIISFYSFTIVGQTGNNTYLTSNCLISFENDIPVFKEFNHHVALGKSISGYDGKLKCLIGINALNPDGSKIYPYESKDIWYNVVLNYQDTFYSIFHLTLNRSINGQFSRKITKSRMHLDNGLYKVSENEFMQDFINSSVYSISPLIPDTIGGFWLIVRVSSAKFVSYYFKDSDTPLDSVTSIIPELSSFEFDSDSPLFHRQIVPSITVSPSGNKLFIYTQFGERGPQRTLKTNNHIGDLLSLDKNTGKLVYSQNIYNYFVTDTSESHFGNIGPSCVFTSDDKKFVFRESETFNFKRLSLQRITWVNFETKEKTILFEDSTFRHFADGSSLGPNYDIKLLNNDEIWCPRYLRYPTGHMNSLYVFNVIENLEKQIPNFQEKKYSFKSTFNTAGRFLESDYNYIKIKPEYDYYQDEASVTIIDKCNYSLPNTKVTYFSEDVAGSGILVPRGENPTIVYNENGDYVLKVVLKSHEGTYREVHYDTLRIRIPPKPVARFRALDTVVCAYSPVGFHNTSSAAQVHPTRGQKWVYTFGDGSTRTLTEWQDSVQHTYTQPGVYTISLFYSNGYSDSTLVLNDHVNVIEASNPGFSILENRGCSPFEIHITDTITMNTLKKEYSFDNGLTWSEVPVKQPDIQHSYSESGVYWVTQRLYSYTGCITQIDSVQVFVCKGFTELDTSHIFVATWQDVFPHQENWVSIEWDCMDKTARFYELKRNNQTIATLTGCNDIGWFDDKEVHIQPNLGYRIKALDSCGTATQIGRIGQPIFLQGEIKGQNEWAVIEFSPYSNIYYPFGEFTYDIQTYRNGVWTSIGQSAAADAYEDKPLVNYEANILEKCYRIVGQNQSQISISNILCLPYLPSVILPSAFSPNGDALNDIYRPLTLGIVSYQMEIYNRWGQLVYSGDESHPGWDGKNAPQGVYVVKIQGIDNQNYFHGYVGSVTLVR